MSKWKVRSALNFVIMFCHFVAQVFVLSYFSVEVKILVKKWNFWSNMVQLENSFLKLIFPKLMLSNITICDDKSFFHQISFHHTIQKLYSKTKNIKTQHSKSVCILKRKNRVNKNKNIRKMKLMCNDFEMWKYTSLFFVTRYFSIGEGRC